MNKLFLTTLVLSLSGSLFIIVICMCKQIMHNTFSKSWNYYIWLVVIARLLLPFSPGINMFGGIFEKMEHTISPFISQSIQIVSSNDMFNTDLDYNNDLSSYRKNNDFSDTILDISENPYNKFDNSITNKIQKVPIIPLFTEIFTLFLSNLWLTWLMISLILLIRKITLYQSFVCYVKAGCIEVSDIYYLELFGKLIEQKRVKHTIELYTNNLVSSPLLIGHMLNPFSHI